MKFSIGSFDSENIKKQGGWFVGQFVSKNLLEHDRNLEISVKKLPKGWGLKDEHELHFHKIAKEFGIVTKGSARVWFDGKIIIIKAGDYYVLSPGCEEKYLEVLEEMELVTIKSPSIANDKICKVK